MSIVVVTPPAVEPVTVTEAKAFCRVDHAADDDLLTALIVAARERCERVSGRALVTQTLRLSLDGWPDDGVVKLPRPPLASVTSIQYADPADGTLTTISSGDYEIDADAEPGTVRPAYGESWPSHREGPRAIRITYVAGYGVAVSVPAEIKQRILNYVAYCFEHPVERDEVWLDSLFEGFTCGNYA